MSIQDIKNIKGDKEELRKFGLTMGIILGILFVIFFIRSKPSYVFLLFFSIIFLCLGIVVPISLKLIHKVWMAFSIIMGWAMTRLIMVILFYLIITPTGLIARLVGKHFLDIRFQKENNAESYWIYRETEEATRSRYEQQF